MRKKVNHLIWMCENMPNKEDNPFKWNRWLGFIQGQCDILGISSIEEMKLLNKRGLSTALETLCLALRIYRANNKKEDNANTAGE